MVAVDKFSKRVPETKRGRVRTTQQVVGHKGGPVIPQKFRLIFFSLFNFLKGAMPVLTHGRAGGVGGNKDI